MNNYEHIANLVTCYNRGILTAAEQAELEQWVKADERNLQLFRELTDPDQFREHLLQMENYQQEQQWQKVIEAYPLKQQAPLRRINWRRWAIAASILLLLGLAAVVGLMTNNKKGGKPDIVKTNTHDIPAPKGTRAIITLADGRTISLDSLTTITQDNVTVVKNAKGEIIYTGKADEVVYNTLNNPRGSGVVNLTLSDGTKVWLNSESSLKYPTAFAGSTRNVEITGEAYFEVAKDASKKFIVQGNGVTTEVLGTHFNVNTYSDEAVKKVTLLEGSINVNGSIIKPGQQAQVSDAVKVLSNVNVDAVMAWKNGYFNFNNADLKTLMRELGRWYDVDVVYEGAVPTMQFGGELEENLNLSQVLEALEKSKVHFRVSGRTIIVTK